MNGPLAYQANLCYRLESNFYVHQIVYSKQIEEIFFTAQVSLNSRIWIFKCFLKINWIWHWVYNKGLQSTVFILLKNQFKSLCQIYIYKFIPP